MGAYPVVTDEMMKSIVEACQKELEEHILPGVSNECALGSCSAALSEYHDYLNNRHEPGNSTDGGNGNGNGNGNGKRKIAVVLEEAKSIGESASLSK